MEFSQVLYMCRQTVYIYVQANCIKEIECVKHIEVLLGSIGSIIGHNRRGANKSYSSRRRSRNDCGPINGFQDQRVKAVDFGHCISILYFGCFVGVTREISIIHCGD